MILLGLGSNIGDRQKNIETAIRQLAHYTEIKIERISSLYETKPVGVTMQPDFLNAVISLSTAFDPFALLKACLHVECQMGRVREERWGPRNIDIDILLYHDVMIEDEVLKIPHPLLHERPFVLIPLQEIAADIKLYQGLTADELLHTIPNTSDVVFYKSLDREKFNF